MNEEIPIHENLSTACSAVLKMTISQLNSFEPRTVAESIAVDYAYRAGRGDDQAFNLLTATADTCFIDQAYEDELSKALQEWSDELLEAYRANHKNIV